MLQLATKWFGFCVVFFPPVTLQSAAGIWNIWANTQTFTEVFDVCNSGMCSAFQLRIMKVVSYPRWMQETPSTYKEKWWISVMWESFYFSCISFKQYLYSIWFTAVALRSQPFCRGMKNENIKIPSNPNHSVNYIGIGKEKETFSGIIPYRIISSLILSEVYEASVKLWESAQRTGIALVLIDEELPLLKLRLQIMQSYIIAKRPKLVF